VAGELKKQRARTGMRNNRRASVQRVPDLIGRLNARRQEMIRGVLENPREYVLLSTRKLARKLGSDPMTTLRTIRDMGFRNYPEFQRYLHDLSILQSTPLDSMKDVETRDANIPAHIRESLSQDFKNLQALRQNLDFRRIERLAKRLSAAHRVVVLGGDLAATLSKLLEYNLAVLGLPPLTPITPGEVLHTVRNASKGDVVIAISFRRGLRQTVEGMREARANGAHCVGITDTPVSPIARYADEFFLVSVEGSYGTSYTAAVALLNVMLVAFANYRRSRVMRLLKEADKEQRTGFRWFAEA
jgi:DNA-binding MurR/RpiR family transcriptional regulator